MHLLICVSLSLSLSVADGRLLDGLPHFPPPPSYLPVNFTLLHADSAFFLKEANQDIMRNSSLLSRTEPFVVFRARRTPLVNATYGPLSVSQPVAMELLQPSGSVFPSSSSSSSTSSSSSSSSSSSPLFTFNWEVQTFIISERVYLRRPRVQVLFYVSGRDWDDYSTVGRLPCVRLSAFHETQEARGVCQLAGDLGLCVAELEPLPGWFSPPSVVPGRQRASSDPSEGTPVELYYRLLEPSPEGGCGGLGGAEDSGARRRAHRPGPVGGRGGFGTPMRRIGKVRLHRAPAAPQLAERRLDGNFAVLVPSEPVRQREAVSAFIATAPYSPVEAFTLRVKLKEGFAFLGARPSNPTLWMVSQDVRSEGHRVVTLHCRRKEVSYGQRVEVGWQRVLQVDLEVDAVAGGVAAAAAVGAPGSHSISWQVEYPPGRGLVLEADTHLQLAQRELGGIVPLAMETEILNTAVLTGKTVAVPVKVVTVGVDGAVTDVSDSVECHSTDEDVVKVSDRCDYVYVNGKEQRGRVRMTVNFTYSYLSAQLEMSVWVPRLPLQIELSDNELSQIKGWRIPIQASSSQRSARDSDDDEEDDRRGRSCTLQYQNAMLRVLTHFVAESAEARGQLTYMLGSDWQVDITGLVWDFLKVEDPRIVCLQEGRRLVGLGAGMTGIQVLSPLSDSILAERTVRVLEERVSIVELGLQLVSGLSLSLQLSPGSNRAVLATATTQEELSNPKQEALVSVWLQFSDGSAAPLDLYDPGSFQLSAMSLDETVVQVQTQAPSRHWPVIVAQGEGQGLLLRVELSVPETCQRYKPRRAGTLASGTCQVRVRFGPPEPPEVAEDAGRGGGGGGGGGRGPPMNRPPQRRPPPVSSASVHYGSSVSDAGDAVMRRLGTTAASTTRTDILRRPGGDKLSDDGSQLPIDFADFPAQVDVPRGRNMDGEDDEGLTDEDLLQTARGLTDLEIGMYALLGVFCLAILVFLINCVSYALKYPHKELGGAEEGGLEGGAAAGPHAHDWVWLGSEGGGAELGLSPHRDEDTGLGGVLVMDSSLGALEEGSKLLNGGGGGVPGLQKHVQGQMRRSPDASGAGGQGGSREAKGDSPTSKRKRVKFTTFSTAAERGSPASESVGSGSGLGAGGDIQWVCRDVELNDSKELRNYMERLSDGVLRDVV
ncbi:transmembrane protein 132C [Alosa pseudoharengus]|uniref:transmembrane protein 132C n=1 Tax=Alosa pseudoharengus TaxID=34774 RepID=UPI003F8B6C44